MGEKHWLEAIASFLEHPVHPYLVLQECHKMEKQPLLKGQGPVEEGVLEKNGQRNSGQCRRHNLNQASLLSASDFHLEEPGLA